MDTAQGRQPVLLEDDTVGRTFPAIEYQVTRELIRDFADAIGDDSPACHDPEAARELGYPDVIAPPTFPIVPALVVELLVFPELGIELGQLVHRDQRFRLTRPVHAGDVLTCAATVEEVKNLGGKVVMTMRVDLVNDKGELVAVSVESSIVRLDAS